MIRTHTLVAAVVGLLLTATACGDDGTGTSSTVPVETVPAETVAVAAETTAPSTVPVTTGTEVVATTAAPTTAGSPAPMSTVPRPPATTVARPATTIPIASPPPVISKGPAVVLAGQCTDPACAYVSVNLNGNPNGSSVSCEFNSGGGWTSFFTYSQNTQEQNYCVFGFTGNKVRVVVNGVASNVVTW